MRMSWLALVVLGIICFATGSHAEDALLERFFGAYEGKTLLHDNESEARQLSVVIRPYATGGFTIRWRTYIYESDDGPKGRTQVIYFVPSTSNSRVFAATKPEDAAGLASDDPLDGRPFAWARISEQVLTIHVLTISETGDYFLQTYERSLMADGLALAFHRLHDGRIEKRLFGTMRRLED